MFPNSYFMSFVTVPTLVIHARDDQTVKFCEGELLYETSPKNEEPLFFDVGGHCDVLEKNEEEYLDRVGDFLKRQTKFFEEKNCIEDFRGNLQPGYNHLYNSVIPIENPRQQIDYANHQSLNYKRA